MAIQLMSNVKIITSGAAPTTANLLPGQAAFGKVNGKYHLYGNTGEGGGAGKVVDIVTDTYDALGGVPNIQTVLTTGNVSTLDILFKETAEGETLLTVGKGGVVAGTTKLTKDGFVDNGKVVLSANPHLVVSPEDAAQMRTFLNVYSKAEVYSKEEVYSKAEVDGKVAGAFHVKGCCDANELPADAKVGDVWNITANTANPKKTDINGKVLVAGDNVVWVGAESGTHAHDAGWDALSGVVDLSNYYTKADIDGFLAEYAKSTDVYTKTEIDGKVNTINANVTAAKEQADKGVADAATAKQAADAAQATANAAKTAAETANTEIGKTNDRVTTLENAGYQTAADVNKILTDGHYQTADDVTATLTTGHYVSDEHYVHTDNNYTASDKGKVDKLVTNGDGTKVLTDNGSYDTLQLSVVSI